LSRPGSIPALSKPPSFGLLYATKASDAALADRVAGQVSLDELHPGSRLSRTGSGTSSNMNANE